MKKILTFIVLSTLFTVYAYAWQLNGGWGGAASYGVGGNNYSYYTTADNLTTDNITEASRKYWHDYLLYQGLTGRLYYDNITGRPSIAFDNFTLKTATNGVTKVADRIEENIYLNALRISANASMSAFQMVDGTVDKFKDNTTISLTGSGGVCSNYNWVSGYFKTLNMIDSYDKLLLHADGTSNSFVDSSIGGHTITSHGGATQSATQSKFGGKSGYFNGSTDYLTTEDSADWDFGTGDFTIDLWVNQSVKVDTGRFIAAGSHTDNQIWWFGIVGTGSQLQFGYYDGSYHTFESSSFTWNVGEWHHAAIVRNGTNLSMYADGTSIFSTSISSGLAFNGGSSGAIVGARYYTSTSSIIELINGYIDELRISKDVARWTSNFTPPTSPNGSSNYPNVDNMTLVSKSTAALSAPTQGRLMVLQEQLDPSAVVNADWKAYISSDNGTNWNQVTLGVEGNYSDNVTMYSGTATYTGTSTGMRWKLQTINKDNMFRGIGHVWN